MTGCLVLVADHPERGQLFAACDPSVRFTGARVGGSRLSAVLAPYNNESAARAALVAAGAANIRERGRP